MYNIILTQSNGFIIGPIAKVMGLILNFLYEFLKNFGIDKVAISIILFTIIVNLLLLPFTIKQQQVSKITQLITPEVQKINKKYKGKKDQESIVKMNQEIKNVYQKYGTHQANGCLPALIQMPIMIALYTVINKVPAYVHSIYDIYDKMANSIKSVPGYEETMKSVAEGLKGIKVNLSSEDAFVTTLSKFHSKGLEELANALPTVQDVIEKSSSQLESVNTLFLGINITDAPGIVGIGIIIPILAGVTQFISTKLSQVQMPQMDDNPMADSLKTMTNIFPFMTAFISITLPAGMGLYFITGSVFRIFQQLALNVYMEKVDVQIFIEKNRKKVNKKRIRKGLEPIDFNDFDSKKLKSKKPIPKKSEQSKNYDENSIASKANIVKSKTYNNKVNKKKGQ